ncbi:MAG: AAA family ATPase [Lentisphaeria bacterium]|nr:AAA family ATPase [Lentisphaeria bacterium]
MKISRDCYINELMIRRQNGMIKVVTGMHRAGKSYLLLKLFHKKLIEEGVPEDHILELALAC